MGVLPIGASVENLSLAAIAQLTCRFSTFTANTACSSNPCGAHGTCVTLPVGYKCTCNKGYEGRHCDTGTIMWINQKHCFTAHKTEKLSLLLDQRIQLMCLQPCCHPIQIKWWFIRNVTIVQFSTSNWLHWSMSKQNSCNFSNEPSHGNIK